MKKQIYTHAASTPYLELNSNKETNESQFDAWNVDLDWNELVFCGQNNKNRNHTEQTIEEICQST